MVDQLIKHIDHWGPAVVCAVLIFGFSHQSDPPGAEWFAAYDYVGHFFEYGIFAFTLVWGITSKLNHPLTGKSLAAVCAVSLVYALSDEWHQQLIPNREASLADVAVDMLGAIVCVMTVYVARKINCLWRS